MGYEGLSGLHVFHGATYSRTRSFVQIAGDAYEMSVSDFIEHLKDDKFRNVIARYADSLMYALGQSVLCMAYHPVEARLARWLLVVKDQIGSSELPLTHEFMSMMLGTQRPTVTIAAGMLKSAGLISYRYGRINILEEENLRQAACSCYAELRKNLFD